MKLGVLARGVNARKAIVKVSVLCDLIVQHFSKDMFYFILMLGVYFVKFDLNLQTAVVTLVCQICAPLIPSQKMTHSSSMILYNASFS